jgi:hypothetical protein
MDIANLYSRGAAALADWWGAARGRLALATGEGGMMGIFSLVPSIVWRGLASLAIVFGVIAYLENRGAEKAIRKVELRNEKAVDLAHRGAAGARRVLDPYAHIDQ